MIAYVKVFQGPLDTLPRGMGQVLRGGGLILAPGTVVVRRRDPSFYLFICPWLTPVSLFINIIYKLVNICLPESEKGLFVNSFRKMFINNL